MKLFPGSEEHPELTTRRWLHIEFRPCPSQLPYLSELCLNSLVFIVGIIDLFKILAMKTLQSIGHHTSEEALVTVINTPHSLDMTWKIGYEWKNGRTFLYIFP